jgi:hypothetical protein
MSAPVIDKVRLATVWLDGCSGCHMSLLDTDERLIDLAKRVTVVWGPLVDLKEFPGRRGHFERRRPAPHQDGSRAFQGAGLAGRLRRYRQRARHAQ